MRGRTHTAALDGGGRVVTVEANVERGLPGLTVRGPSAEGLGRVGPRVRCALAHCGHTLSPRQQIVEPTSVGASPGIDLALACAVLVGHGVIPAKSLAHTLLWAELSADGYLQPTPATPLAAQLARAVGFRRIVVSPADAREITDVSGLDVLPVAHLANLVARLRGELPLAFAESSLRALSTPATTPDMADLRGLTRARAAVELMIAGHHHALVRAPACEESTMLIERLAGLLPEPDESIAAVRLELASRVAEPLTPIHVLDPRIEPEHLLGYPARPGPADLAHGGVLVLDNLRRYPVRLLDAVTDVVRGVRVEPRPIIGVRRARAAEFVVLAFARPSQAKRPRKSDRPGRIAHEFDLFADLELPVPNQAAGDSTEVIRARITTARLRQHERFRGRWPDLEWTCNAKIPNHPNCLDEFAPTSESGRAVLDYLANEFDWTTSQRGNVMRIARTIADLDLDRDPLAPLDRECIASAAMFANPRRP
jgi:magnesium chelatase family protein